MGKRRPKSRKANRPTRKRVVIEQLNINLPPAAREGNWWKRSKIALASLSISLITLLFGNGLLLRFINSPVPPIPNVPLRVQILSPANGSTFTVGNSVPIIARATIAPPAKVTGVSFYANRVKVAKRDVPFPSTVENSFYSSVWFPERGYNTGVFAAKLGPSG